MQTILNFPVRRSLRNVDKKQKEDNSHQVNEDFNNGTNKARIHSKFDRKRNFTRQRESFEENVICCETPNEKRRKLKRKITPRFQKTEISKNERLSQYQLAKHLLSASTVSCIVGRESECSDLRKLIEEHLESQISTSIYVSGPPGTGKSACINSVFKLLSSMRRFKFLKMNGMNFRNSNSLFKHIASELQLNSTSKAQTVVEIEKTIKHLKQPLVIVIDEVDNLTEKHQEALYTFFDWPRIAPKNVIVIGIANTLDFTSRVLPRFHFLKLQRVNEIYFSPYTKDQIKQIIKSRLTSFRYQDIIKPVALEMIARKVSSHSGDARKALNLCEKAIELLENEEKKRSEHLKASNDDGFNLGSDKNTLNNGSMLSVEISHVMKVLNQVYGSESSKDSCNDISYLPTQQQIILCIFLMFSKFKGQKEIEFKKCYEVFGKICSRKGLSFEQCNISDFRSMCDLLESKAFLTIKQIKDSTKVGLKNDENEMRSLMLAKPFFANLLDDSTYL